MKISSTRFRHFICRVSLGMSLVAVSGASDAHHSFAMFDPSKQAEIQGVVKDFRFINPHTYFQLEVIQPGGTSTTYLMEAPTPTVLKRLGWTNSTLHAGDKITVIYHPLRDGAPGGNAIRVTLPDGKVMSTENEDIKYGTSP